MLQAKRTFAENYVKLKRTLAEDYDIISWLLRIISGGLLNIVFLNALLTFVSSHTSYTSTPNGVTYYYDLFAPSVLPQFIIFVAMVLFGPFFMSLILTKRSPNLRIVPPYYVAAMGAVYLLASQIAPLEPNRDFLTVMFGLIMVAMGSIEDKFVTSILGLATDRENIYFEQLTVFAHINDVKTRLCIPEIRDELNLSYKIEGDARRGYTFCTKGGNVFINKIQLTRNKDYPHEATDFKVAYYEKAKYNLRASPAFLEHSKKTVAYLNDILYNRVPSLAFAVISEFQNNVRDPFVDSVVDEMYGYYAKSKRLSFPDVLKIVAMLGIFVMTIALFVYEQPLYGGISAALDALIVLSELPDLVRKQT
jgi:hypothetical protein